VSLVLLRDASRTQRILARSGPAVSGWYAVAMALTASLLPAQLQWTPIPDAPNTSSGGILVYVGSRDRVVSLDSASLYEFDGATWVMMASLPFTSVHWTQPDHRGYVLIAATTGQVQLQHELWEWRGTSLVSRGPLPAPLNWASYGHFSSSSPVSGGEACQLMFHDAVQGPTLTSWNGLFFTQLPAGLASPPTIGQSNSKYGYFGLAHDERDDRLVLFGRSHISSQGQLLSSEGITWEWSPGAGWQFVGTSGSVPNHTRVWYDRHRGCLMRMQTVGGVTSFHRRTGPTSWTGVPLLGSAMFLAPYTETYDPIRNRLYARSGTGSIGYIGDAYPSEFEWHGTHCTQNLSPGLHLTESWSRAWIGQTLSVDIVGLNGPLAGLGMGFDDQFYNGVPLPLSLASIGMPSCFLNVDPAATAWANVTGTTATMTLPIPFTQALVGVEYFQQPFAVDPGANAVGVVLGNSIRGTVGRQQ